MGYVTLKLKADEAQAVEGFRKLTAAEQQAVLASKKLASQSNRTDRTLKKIGRSARDIAGALGVGFGIGAAMGKIVELTNQWFAGLDRIAQKGREAGREMTALALMQEGGQVRKNVLAAAKLAGRYGVSMGEGWSTVQAFQSKTGSFKQGMALAGAAFDLTQKAGVPAADSRSGISIAVAQGLTPRGAAAALYGTGEASELTPAEIAKGASTALPKAAGVGGGAIFGLGLMAAISGVIKEPERLGTITRQVLTGLQKTTGKQGATWRRLGITEPGKDPIGQLQALRKAIPADKPIGQALEEMGFAEKQSLGFAIALKDLPRTLATIKLAKKKSLDLGLMSRKYGAATGEMPEMVYKETADKLEQEFNRIQTFGPEAKEAAERDVRQRKRGVAAAKKGFGWLADQEGRMGGWGAFAWSVLSNPAYVGGPGQGAQLPAQDLTESNERRLAESNERLAESNEKVAESNVKLSETMDRHTATRNGGTE